jgi:hypothetical protein
MVHSSQQLTPQQLLEAGHRAEGEGKFDLAAQFYRHLTEHFTYTSEAAESRNGMGRIGATQAQVWHTNGVGPGHHGDGPGRSQAARPPRRRPLAPRDHYRTGRALAAMSSAAGWLMVLVGLALPFLPLLPVSGLPSLPLSQLIVGAAGLCVFGLAATLGGQAVRALFDQANATRELLALERAKFNHD